MAESHGRTGREHADSMETAWRQNGEHVMGTRRHEALSLEGLVNSRWLNNSTAFLMAGLCTPSKLLFENEKFALHSQGRIQY